MAAVGKAAARIFGRILEKDEHENGSRATAKI